MVAVFLGCQRPFMLRPQPNHTFLVICTCYVPDLMAGEAFLGSLPKNWSLDRDLSTGWWVVKDSETNDITINDPRLGEIPDGWSFATIDGRHGEKLQCFLDLETGEKSELDPRMSPAALQARGVTLQDIVIDLGSDL